MRKVLRLDQRPGRRKVDHLRAQQGGQGPSACRSWRSSCRAGADSSCFSGLVVDVGRQRFWLVVVSRIETSKRMDIVGRAPSFSTEAQAVSEKSGREQGSSGAMRVLRPLGDRPKSWLHHGLFSQEPPPRSTPVGRPPFSKPSAWSSTRSRRTTSTCWRNLHSDPARCSANLGGDVDPGGHPAPAEHLCQRPGPSTATARWKAYLRERDLRRTKPG